MLFAAAGGRCSGDQADPGLSLPPVASLVANQPQGSGEP
jgi:hypothetical protein